VRPLSAPLDEVYAMKVLKKSEVIKRHQVEHTLTERVSPLPSLSLPPPSL
jgi:hypothetical protein